MRSAFLISLLIGSLCVFTSPAMAHDHGAEEENAPHLIVEAPKTDIEARASLTAELKKLNESWAKSDLDSIHVSSYYLEAALTRLEESAAEAGDDARSTTLAALQEHVYTMHHAAEDGDKTTVGNHLTPLIKGLKALLK